MTLCPAGATGGAFLFLHSAQLTMGEYAIRKSDRESIKIGTCEDMYYLRYEDQNKVTPDECSGFGYRWRIPFPDEDHILPGEYDSGFRQVDLDTAVFCGDNGEDEIGHYIPPEDYQGCKLYRLDCLRSADGQIHPVVCGYKSDKGDRWSYEERFRDKWPSVLPFIKDEQLKQRLQKYYSP